jgi:1-acyl-sn-glycerol-3-phosphate acyltransferase
MLRLFVWWFKLKGWKIKTSYSGKAEKGVIIAAPHTSNWDFVYSLAALRIVGIDAHYLIKKEWFKWPLAGIMRRSGGIPVERKKTYNKLVESIIEMFKQKDELILMIATEGTRKRVDKWKKGFYNIAVGANVPIYPAYLDYKKKEAGIGAPVWLTGDKQKDAQLLRDFYSDKTAKFPEDFNLDAIRFD